jgi:hypothetical protein
VVDREALRGTSYTRRGWRDRAGWCEKAESEGLRGKARARQSFFTGRRRAGIYERERQMAGRRPYADNGVPQWLGPVRREKIYLVDLFVSRSVAEKAEVSQISKL